MGIDLRADTEARIRELLEEAGLPEPDEVEYRRGEIVLLWHDRKLAVVIEAIPHVEDEAA